MNIDRFVFVSVFLLTFLAEAAIAIPSFPGAEGFGASSIGGRGGIVIKVTNLNDSGPGSFREAVTASDPRIVVFDISGIINLESPVEIFNSYLTIAGQTSPGGILITGYTTRTRASHITIQHMRFRVGSHRVADGADPETLDSFNIWGQTNSTTSVNSDIMIDHCSFGWGIDDNISTSYNLRNVTISNSIISEALSQAGHPKGEHSKGLFINGTWSQTLNVTLHNNYIAHNTDRNPLITGNAESVTADVVNNVIYNWKGGLSPATQGDGVKVNWVHNYSKGGPQSNIGAYYEVTHNGGSPAPNIYVLGNIGGTRMTQTGSDWTVGRFYYYELLDDAWRSMVPWPVGSMPITMVTMSADYALEVVNNAGATKPIRDVVDARVANDFAKGTGMIIENIKFPDEFPSYQDLPPPTDIDEDGMADEWEVANGYDASSDDSARDADNDGYTNIEEYLHFLAGNTGLVRPAPPVDLSAEPT